MSEVGDSTCRSCGEPVAAAARFCPACGAPRAQRGDERRVVTVLFADLVGFTTLAEHRDPEQVKNLVDRCFERLAADVADYGGRVDKVVGDGLLALFGAPVAHEDDAERAVRCALRMQRTLEDWAGVSGVDGLRMRIGINSGEVLVGALRAAGDTTAMGDVVNTASRLQTLAEPGTVVVGADTHAATTAAIRYTPLGELRAKGREALVEAWVAEVALAPPGRRARRLDVPIVGRSLELGLLGHVVETAVTRNRAATVVVAGEAGMGKSRLVEELASRAETAHGAVVWEGRCVPYGEANPWWPVAEALRSSMDAPLGTPAEELRRLVRDRVALGMGAGAGEDEVDRVTEGLVHLLGEPGTLDGIDPQRAREEVVRSLTLHLEAWACHRPIVVVLSDVHWADDVVLELADRLAERAPGLPMVLLCTARASLFERWSPRIGAQNATVVHLDPLDRTAASELLDHLAADLPDDLRTLVLDRSDGNPFFLEELVALLQEGAGRTGVPHTLRGLVAARLDALPLVERQLLQDASVLGRRFRAFSAVTMGEKSRGLGRAEVEAALAGLVAKDLLGSDGDEVYEFRSELVREVAYETLTKADRIRSHHGVASWLEAHPSGVAGDVDRIAFHLATAAELAGDLGPGRLDDKVGDDLPVRAVDAVRRAVEVARHSDHHRHVVRLAGQAVDLAGAAGLTPAEELEFVLARARARVALRELDDAEGDLGRADELAALDGTPATRAAVLARRGDLLQKRGDHAESTAALDEAIAVYRALGDDRRVAEALLLAGVGHIFTGDVDRATEHLTDALDISRSLGDRRGEGWALQNLAWVAFSAGRIAEADARSEESIAIFADLGDPAGTAWAVGLKAFVRFHQGRYDEAEALNEVILEEAASNDDPWASGMMLTLRGLLRLWTGRSESAIEPAREATERFAAQGDWYGQMLSSGVLARSLIATGRIDEGFEVIDRSVAVASGSTNQAAPMFAAVQVLTSSAQAGRPDLAGRAGADTIAALRDRETGEVGFTDAAIASAILALQQGQVAVAAGTMEAVVADQGEGPSGYALSSLALARAAAGDTGGALAAAEAAWSMTAATYLDRFTGAVAAALAAARAGDAERSDEARQRARAALEGTDDRLARGLLAVAVARADAALGRPVAPGAGAEAAADAPGWDAAYRLAAGL